MIIHLMHIGFISMMPLQKSYNREGIDWHSIQLTNSICIMNVNCTINMLPQFRNGKKKHKASIKLHSDQLVFINFVSSLLS